MEIKYTLRAKKDLKKIYNTPYRDSFLSVIKMLQKNPYFLSPYFEKLSGYSSRYSRRINIQHRLVYEIKENSNIILSCWGHYE